jgi:hypothetical protein
MILDNSDIAQHCETLWYLTMHGKQKHKVCMLILPNYGLPQETAITTLDVTMADLQGDLPS